MARRKTRISKRITGTTERIWKRYEDCMERCKKRRKVLKFNSAGVLVGIHRTAIGACSRVCTKRIANAVRKGRFARRDR